MAHMRHYLTNWLEDRLKIYRDDAKGQIIVPNALSKIPCFPLIRIKSMYTVSWNLRYLLTYFWCIKPFYLRYLIDTISGPVISFVLLVMPLIGSRNFLPLKCARGSFQVSRLGSICNFVNFLGYKCKFPFNLCLEESGTLKS